MMTNYERVVEAALAETASKFRLAEALALDIPPRRRGPADDSTIPQYLAEAGRAIVTAGGEPRAVKTLSDYRLTALWVSTEVGGNFRWIPGVSFSAHREAFGAGMSYGEFAKLPSKTVDVVRRVTGRAGTDGPATQIARSWTPEQRAEVVREALAEPEVADKVVADEQAARSFNKAYDRKVTETLRSAGVSGRMTSEDRPTLSSWSAALFDLDILRIMYDLKKYARLLSELETPIPASYRDDLLSSVGEMRVSLDYIESAVRRETADWDAALKDLGER